MINFGALAVDADVLDPHLSIFLRPERIYIGSGARLDGLIKIEGGLGVHIGANVHIASFCHLNGAGGRLILEDHSGLASGVKIPGGLPDLTYRFISAAEPPDDCHVVRKTTKIGRFVVVFSNAVILPGVIIGEGAVVAAGAVVTKDVAPYSIVAGVPAVRIGEREIWP